MQPESGDSQQDVDASKKNLSPTILQTKEAKEFAARNIDLAEKSLQQYISQMKERPMDAMKYGIVSESAVAKAEVWKKIDSDFESGMDVGYVCGTLLNHILAMTPHVAAATMRPIDLHILAETAAAYNFLKSL